MFNRIALAWIWAIIMLLGLMFPPDLPERWVPTYMIGLTLVFVYQCIFVVVMTNREYWRLRNQHADMKDRAYDLEEAAIREAAGYE